jgi:hypothetical protein
VATAVLRCVLSDETPSAECSQLHVSIDTNELLEWSFGLLVLDRFYGG